MWYNLTRAGPVPHWLPDHFPKIGRLSVPYEPIWHVRNRVRQSRTLGSVRGGARQRPRLLSFAIRCTN